MDREELKAIVAQMLRELAPAQTPPSPPPVKGAETAPEAPPDDGVLPDLTTVDLRAQYLVPNAAHGAEFRALKAKTPARLGLGRCGARYPTASLLRFRADHAAAQDSVFSLVPERFWEENHYPFVQTMCKSKDEYLTRPDLGRRFDEKNQAVLRDLLAGQRVVLAVGDGLSSAAVQANAPDCCAAIHAHGLLVKLDTNGTLPDRLERLLDAGLVDYVAMDVKNVPARYAETVGRADFDFGIIRRSLDALRRSGIPYELRTTVMRELHTADNLLELASMLSDDPAWYLQQFRESAGIIAGTGVFHAWSASDMRKLLPRLQDACPAARLRGFD